MRITIYQRETLRVLGEKYPEFNKITDKAVEEVIKAAQPCRLKYVTSASTHKIRKDKTIFLDVAHNQPAIVSYFLKKRIMTDKNQRSKLI